MLEPNGQKVEFIGIDNLSQRFSSTKANNRAPTREQDAHEDPCLALLRVQEDETQNQHQKYTQSQKVPKGRIQPPSSRSRPFLISNHSIIPLTKMARTAAVVMETELAPILKAAPVLVPSLLPPPEIASVMLGHVGASKMPP